MKTNVMVDSGAFSAWRLGKPIILDEYIKYLKDNKDHYWVAVALDVIPGKDGKIDKDQKVLEESAEQSLNNLIAMKEAGLSPIPVFHQGENIKWLEKMVDMGETYIGISPYLRAHRSEIIEWMDSCFAVITDKKGRPTVKTHGFGVTSNILCLRYPWFSVDSTTWAVGGGVGNLEIPRYHRGKPDFSLPPVQVHLTHREHVPGEDSGKRSFDGLSDMEQECVIRFVTEECNVSLTEARNSHTHRWRVRLTYYRELERRCKNVKFVQGKPMFFTKSHRNGLPPLSPWTMTLVYSTTALSMQHSRILNKFKIKNRLLSYFILKDLPDLLPYYTRHGLIHKETGRTTVNQRTGNILIKKVNKTNWGNESYLMQRRLDTERRSREYGSNETAIDFDAGESSIIR